MAIPWLVVLKSVPWTDVIRNAPKVVDGAKRLWSTVRKKDPLSGLPTDNAETPLKAEPQTVASLHARLSAIEPAIAELHNEMLASSELITTLAEQNTQLIERIETNRVRVIWLAGATGVFAIIAVVSLVLGFMR